MSPPPRSQCWWILYLGLLYLVPHGCHAQLTVSAIFNQDGISGDMVFSQASPSAATTIAVDLTGLGDVAEGDLMFPWHVHEFPFPHDAQPNPCRPQITGGHYDPFGQSTNPDYTERCAMNMSLCEVGDLSGRLGPLSATRRDTYTDPFLSLHGVYSVIGRSIVIHFPNGTRFVCANIGYPSRSAGSVDLLLYVPFRNYFAGSIYFRQHTDGSTASVFTDLVSSSSGDSSGHNWHVHENLLAMPTADCMMAGGHYNPRGVDFNSAQYQTLCSPDNQTSCEIGDLTGKSTPLDVRGGVVRHFYTDTDLPLSANSEGFSIANRSVVIHGANRTGARIACANIARFQPLEVEAVFTGQNDSGISGRIRFTQTSPFDRTRVMVSLTGLGGMVGGYHVHVNPIGPDAVGFPERCNNVYAGGHWNPLNAMYGEGEDPPQTSDEYEVGDLSGKFGSLTGMDAIDDAFYDPNLPLFGPLGIVGRSVVIHMDNEQGTRLVCADIGHTRPVVEVRFDIQSGNVTGRVILRQPADDPLADTIITVQLDVVGGFEPPPPQLTSSAISTPSPSIAMTTTTIVMTTTTIAMTSLAISPTPSLVVAESTTLVSPSEGPTSTPAPSPSSFSVLPSETDIMLMPESPSSTLVPSSTPSRRRRSLPDAPLYRSKRQAVNQAVQFNWDLRLGVAMAGMACDSLPVLGTPLNLDLCSQDTPLLCSAGDLASKHGPLSLPSDGGSFRAVFTDPNLPLSGPDSPFETMSPAPVSLLLQPLPGQTTSEVTSCNGDPGITTPEPATAPPPPVTTPTTPPPGTTPTTTSPVVESGGSRVGAVAGGVVAAILLVALVIAVIVLVVWCWRKKTGSKYDLSKASQMEMGTRTPSKPVIGVPNYKVLHNYEPQNEDDLRLVIGEWVTLEEAPYGGGWWRGTVEGEKRPPGWFPKTYVEYVDREAEKKKKQDESFTLAAAAIMGASSTFSSHHPSMSTRRASVAAQYQKSKQPKRSHTFNKNQIDSTPKMVTKFDKPYLEREDVVIIENQMKDSSSVGGGSRPDTPGSVARNEMFTNTQVESGSSQEDHFINQVKGQLDLDLEKGEVDLMPHTDKHVAKYDFAGTTDIELHFKKGNVIQVLEKADNGWWQGVCQGLVGWFPESYVDHTPIKVAKEADSRGVPPGRGGDPDAEVEKPRNMDETMAADGDLEALEYRAVFSYHSTTEGDLVFGEGDPVLVYWAQDNGWWYGTSGGREPGWFPGSYVEPIIDTSISEAAVFSEDGIQGGVEDAASGGRGAEAVPGGVELDKANAKRAPSSDSQDSGVGQEDDNKHEDLGKSSGLQDQLSNALLKKLSERRGTGAKVEDSTPAPAVPQAPQDTLAQISEDTSPDAKPTQPSRKEPPAVEQKLKPVKGRRQSAPAKAHRRLAPPPPPASGSSTPTQTQKVPKDLEASPQVPRTPTSEQNASDSKPGEGKTELGVKTEPSAIPQPSATKPATPTAGPSDLKPGLSSTLPIAVTATKAATPTLSTEAQPTATKPTAARKVPKQRRTTAVNRATPRRRPPPPKPPALLEAAAAASAPEAAKLEETPASRVSEDGGKVKVQTPTSTPIPPPRAKARMKRVKRPTRRTIPPPPSIPLPPPPTKKISPLTDAQKAEATITSSTQPGTPTSPRAEGAGDVVMRTPKPKPPPPKRISSLTPEAKVRSRIKRIATPERTEATAATVKEDRRAERPEPVAADSKGGRKSTKLTPPKRPPPPRPTSALSNQSATKPERPSRPPLNRPVPTPDDTTESTDGIRSRGSGLMGSLRRMVKRDSKKDIDKAKKADAEDGGSSSKQPPPQRPAQPPSRSKSEKEVAQQPLLSEENSPVPKPRSKKKSSVSEPPGVPAPSSGEKLATLKLSDVPPITIPPTSQSPTKTPEPESQPAKSPIGTSPPTRPSYVPKPSSPASKSPPGATQPESPTPQPQPQQRSSIPPKPLPPVTAAKPKPPVAPKPSSLSSSPRSPAQTFDLPEPKTDGSNATADPRSRESQSQSPANFYRATKSYTAKADTELSFSAGDTVMFIEKREGGFYYGMLDNGTTGLFPLEAVEHFLR